MHRKVATKNIFLSFTNFLFLAAMHSESHWVCKPAYLVPVPSQDKLGRLCKEGDPA